MDYTVGTSEEVFVQTDIVYVGIAGANAIRMVYQNYQHYIRS